MDVIFSHPLLWIFGIGLVVSIIAAVVGEVLARAHLDRDEEQTDGGS